MSASTSKRNSLASLATNFHPNTLASPANSVPPSPVNYVPSYASSTASASASVMPKIHEHTAQSALKDSPSPQQFDLSSANSAAVMLAAAIQHQNAQMGMYMQQQGSNGQDALHNLYTPHQQQPSQQPMHARHHPPANIFSPVSASGTAVAAAEQQSQEAAAQLAAASMPSPLDLNSFFGMLGAVQQAQQQAQVQGTSPASASVAATAAVPFAHKHGSTASSPNMKSPEHPNGGMGPMDMFLDSNNKADSQLQLHQQYPNLFDSQGSAYLGASTNSTDSNDYAAFLAEASAGSTGTDLMQTFLRQQQQQASYVQPSLYPEGALSRFLGQQHGHSMPDASVAAFSASAPASSSTGGAGGGGSAPLTPAAFMNLTQGRLDLLTGLQADQSQSHFQQGAQLAHVPSQNSRPGTAQQVRSSGFDSSNESYKRPSTSKRGSAHTSPVFAPVPDGGDGSALSHQKFMLPPSPALVAQSIKEAAAAAIAAKEAKSAAKGRGAGRKKALAEAAAANGAATTATAGKEATSSRKTGKRAAAQAAESAVQANAKEDAAMDYAGTDGLSIGASANPFTSAGNPDTSNNNNSAEQSPVIAPENRKSSHKIAEQRRRDSLKLCFEELRFILPPINPDEDEDFAGGGGNKRPGENNVGGQRGKAHNVDPKHPNKGISKVALLRKSNECASFITCSLESGCS